VRRRPIVLGLTGSIAMGKSEAAKMFRRFGVPVFDADAEVHSMLDQGGEAVGAVSKAFPSAIRNGAVDRRSLGDRVFGRAEEVRKLETILHPLVGKARNRFVRLAGASRAAVVVMDVPLLFETGGSGRYHAVVVVSAPHFVQRSRALKRPGMSEKKLSSIIEKQISDQCKRRRADFVVLSGLGKRNAYISVSRILRLVRSGAFPRGKIGRRGLKKCVR